MAVSVFLSNLVLVEIENEPESTTISPKTKMMAQMRSFGEKLNSKTKKKRKRLKAFSPFF